MSKKNMYENEEELRDYEYEDIYEVKLRRRKRIGIAILVLLVLFFIFMFVKSWFSDTEEIIEVSDNEKNLLKAGKEYFKINYDDMPEAEGSYEEVTLEKLLLDGLIEKKNFQNCHGKKTKVKVSILENGKEQWTPFLQCDEISTEFSEWKEGEPSDLTKDQSDVRFVFKGEVLNLEEEDLSEDEEVYWEEEVPYDVYKTNETTEYYKKRDKYYVWDVNTKSYYPGSGYYVSSPASGYIYKDRATTAAKYYKNGNKQYWNNGSYSVTNPGGGYNNKDSAVNVTVYRTRSWVELAKPVKTYPKTMYSCGKEGSSLTIRSNVPCSSRTDTYKVNKGTIYTCNGYDTVSSGTVCSTTCSNGSLNSSNTSCGSYSGWSGYTSTPCSRSEFCDKITITTYRWYKTSRQYYSNTAFYISAPASGYYRDSVTATTAYKWYKLTKTGQVKTLDFVAPNAQATYTGKTVWGEWTSYSTTKPASSKNTEVETKTKVSIRKAKGETKDKWQDLSDDYVKEDELLKLFRKNSIDVKTLDDIKEKNGEAKYKIKMYYRSRV